MTDLVNVGELRDIPGYECLYAVTRDGRVWTYPRKWRSGEGNNNTRRHGGMWLRQRPQTSGYMLVGLRKNGVKTDYLVHRMVASAWIENPLGLPQVNHMNGIKNDNRDSNLTWCTGSDNRKHAFATGLSRVSDAARAAASLNIRVLGKTQRKLTGQQAASIRLSKLSCAAEAHANGVSESAIRALRNGKTYVER